MVIGDNHIYADSPGMVYLLKGADAAIDGNNKRDPVIARFLYGYNGTDPGIDQTYRISVEFGIEPQVNITIKEGVRNVLGGFNTACCNTQTLNDTASTYFAYPPIPMAKTFKTAVDNGILELPFNYQWVVAV